MGSVTRGRRRARSHWLQYHRYSQPDADLIPHLRSHEGRSIPFASYCFLLLPAGINRVNGEPLPLQLNSSDLETPVLARMG